METREKRKKDEKIEHTESYKYICIYMKTLPFSNSTVIYRN